MWAAKHCSKLNTLSHHKNSVFLYGLLTHNSLTHLTHKTGIIICMSFQTDPTRVIYRTCETLRFEQLCFKKLWKHLFLLNLLMNYYPKWVSQYYTPLILRCEKLLLLLHLKNLHVHWNEVCSFIYVRGFHNFHHALPMVIRF
jgi:hypothetical protein